MAVKVNSGKDKMWNQDGKNYNKFKAKAKIVIVFSHQIIAINLNQSNLNYYSIET